jgi:hypothetical protein
MILNICRLYCAGAGRSLIAKSYGQHPATAVLVERVCNRGLNEGLREYSEALKYHLRALSAQTFAFSAL